MKLHDDPIWLQQQHDLGYSLREIARLADVSKPVIKSRFIRFNIKNRTISEALKIKPSKHIWTDEDRRQQSDKMKMVQADRKIELSVSAKKNWEMNRETIVAGIKRAAKDLETIRSPKLRKDEAFLKKAVIIHGDRYDYSQMLYIDRHIKIAIRCKEHGIFLQEPSRHLRGHNCPNCAGSKRRTTIEFTTEAILIHGDRYDYSQVDYKSTGRKVKIICKEHGEFQQVPVKHLAGQHCPRCAKNKKFTIGGFIERARLVHNNKYDYSRSVYQNIDVKIKIICPKHGEFWQTPYEHLNGHECIVCGNNSISQSEFIDLAKQKYGDKYDYSLVRYRTKKDHISIICKAHGLFQQTPMKHLHINSRGCPKCWVDGNRYTTQEFVEAAVAIHGARYDYSNVDYIGCRDEVQIKCKEHGSFLQAPYIHLQNHGCPNCPTVVSRGHQKLIDFLQSYVEIVSNDRTIIKPYEIDIWIPSKQFGIDFHGYFYHGINNKIVNKPYIRNRHYLKSKSALEANIKLFQFFDYEYLRAENLIHSMILHQIGLSTRIYARNCEIHEGPVGQFYHHNHLYGHRDANTNLALLYNNEIVAAIGFVKHHKYNYEISRFCCKTGISVVGGFSKLLTAFRIKYMPLSILSYSDRRFSNGKIYSNAGFMHAGVSKPNYHYIKQYKVLSRYTCQKAKLYKLLGSNFDENASESQNMINNGYTQVFDAGHDKWVLISKHD